MPKKAIVKKSAQKASRNKAHSRKVPLRKTFSLRGIFKKSSTRTKLLFIIGLIFIGMPLYFYANEGIQLAFFTPHVVVVHNTYPSPVSIRIPSVQIDLPIQETAIHGSIWEISQDSISHLAISARPGEKGTIILYGHNTNDRFGPIRWISVGQHVLLRTTDGKTHTYKVITTEDVSPNKVGVLTSQKGETLILYTCDGFADLLRFLVIAKPL